HTRFSRDWSSDVCSSDLFMPENSNALVQSVRAMIQDGPLKRNQFGRNGHAFYMQNLQRDSAIQAIAEVINSFRRMVHSSGVEDRSEERRVGKESNRKRQR